MTSQLQVLRSFFDNLTKYGLEYFKRYYGFYRGTCMKNDDPKEQGRILLRVPIILRGETHPVWAWPIMPWGGKNSGDVMVPDEGDPIYVCFENGDPRYPQYLGGYWPNPGENYFPTGVYTDGKPTKRLIRTKAGHELSFEDNQENLAVKVIWHDPENDLTSSFEFTPDGSTLWKNHKNAQIEMKATDDEEAIIIKDDFGNISTMNADGIVSEDANGNVITLAKDLVEVNAAKDVIVKAEKVHLNSGAIEAGGTVTDKAVKGNEWLNWWNQTVKIYIDTHQHPTGVGPSGPPIKPVDAPVEATLLTDVLKME